MPRGAMRAFVIAFRIRVRLPPSLKLGRTAVALALAGVLTAACRPTEVVAHPPAPADSSRGRGPTPAWTDPAPVGTSGTVQPAKQPAPSTPPVPQSPVARPRVVGTAKLTGRILADDTGAPLDRARVSLVAEPVETAAPPTAPAADAEVDERRITLTDRQGRYAFGELPAGRYRISASKTGYVSRKLGQQRTSQPGTTIDVPEGGAVEIPDVRLPRGGVIAGRLFDEDARPISGALVEASRIQTQEGQRVLTAIGTHITDDLGNFRISGLPAGNYFLSGLDLTFTNAIDATGPLDYAPTYYPGVNYVGEARRITLEAVGQITNVTFNLRIARPSRIGGRIVSAEGRQLLSGAVIITPHGGGKLIVGPVASAQIGPDGAFMFDNVPPGRYMLRARAETSREEPTLFAAFVLQATGTDMTSVRMELTPGAILTGRIEFDAKKTPAPDEVARVLVSAPNEDGTLFGGLPKDRIQPDGTFKINGVQAGSRFIRLEGIPVPWGLQGVYLQGRDITDIPLDVQNGDLVHGLRVLLTDRSTDLSGAVRGPHNEPLHNWLVLIFSVDVQLWRPQSRHIRLLAPSVDGRYQVRGLPPGEYFVAPVLDLDEAEVFDPELLARYVDSAVRVRLQAGQKQTQDIRVAATAQLASRD
jgi:hypothetical protein